MPFKKGQSGNPSGRTKGTVDVVAELNRQLKAKPKDLQEIVKALIDEAKSGNTKAIEIILDRLNGKVAQTVSNPDGTPLVFVSMMPGLQGKPSA